MRYLLDTHVWIWWNARPEALSERARRMLGSPESDDEFLLSAASVWEFCQLLSAGRLRLTCSPDDWIETALDMPGLRLVPLSPRICVQSVTLPQPFDGDPTDRAIVATAREENATVLTSDPVYADYGHVRTVW